ncbi:6600_t:CDS:2 [Funneliformis caledonium]|uniref:6600_t:CDS:1 n=1 Tax=Funneliformis caledonium TaxID=1117310 RepID=A0A9N9C3U7_9GLOM|nr:6600_t:CDS:2 [Funneliformis caledonium]
MLSRSPLELRRKDLSRKKERSKWDTKKWNTNGTIRKVQCAGVYFVDPLALSELLLNKIWDGEFMALYGACVTGKTIQVFKVMEQLEEEGYLCLYISLEVLDKDSKEVFWSLFGKCLIRTTPQHIKERIKSASEFADSFLKSRKAIYEKLKKTLNESPTLNISIWLDFTASNRLEEAIRFLSSIQIKDSEEQKLVNFLTAEGVLTVVNKDDNVYRMSSAFMDELMRQKVILDLYKSCPESAIPKKHDNSLDILNILQIAIQFFNRDIIFKAFDRSYKIADDFSADTIEYMVD